MGRLGNSYAAHLITQNGNLEYGERQCGCNTKHESTIARVLRALAAGLLGGLRVNILHPTTYATPPTTYSLQPTPYTPHPTGFRVYVAAVSTRVGARAGERDAFGSPSLSLTPAPHLSLSPSLPSSLTSSRSLSNPLSRQCGV